MGEVTRVAEAIEKGHAVIANAEDVQAAVGRIDDAVDGVVEVVEVFRTKPAALVAAGLVGLAAGAAGGYFLARKLLEQQYDDLAQEEIAEAKEFYAGFNKVDLDGTPLTPQDVLAARQATDAIDKAIDALQDYAGTPADAEPEDGFPKGEPHDEVVDEEMIAKLEGEARENKVKTPYRDAFKAKDRSEINVFADDTFDLAEEQKFRTEDKPYIITSEEYLGAEREYEQWAYTYFEVDGVLVDEQDKPIENSDHIVGEQHLVRFGSGSGDPNIVYIRNDKLGADIEISRSKGSYLEEVLGIPNEDENSLKHSDTTRINRRRAFRNGDG